MKSAFSCVLMIAVIVSVAGFVTAGVAAEPSKPKLIVLVYFDQLRGDYLSRWEAEFGEGGFKRLMADGAWFQNCHYPYAYTVTGAGHASVATGCQPSEHGVVGNDWYERAVKKTVNCVGSDKHVQVPPKTLDDPDEDPASRGGVSPQRMLKPSIADALKLGTAGKGKVVALSLKNRGASLPGGKTPDVCCWMDGGTGEFVTSTFYSSRLPGWVKAFNEDQPAERWRDGTWERFRSDLDYTKLSGRDDGPGESEGAGGQGKVFPHPFKPKSAKVKPAYYSALFASPFGNELLFDLAVKAISAESLGADDVPDLLSLSFSSNDAVGHAWGPDSHEVLDITLRSDQIVKRLLETLDAKVGKDRYLLVMTADHGVCPLPEASRRQGLDAERVQPATSKKIEEFLTKKYGKPTGKWLEAISGPWIYLNAKTLKATGLKQADAEAALAEWLKEQDGVQAVYTRTALVAGIPNTDPVGEMVARSFYLKRCGDVYIVLKPFHLMSGPLGTGTTHGTPWEYDTHVPLMVYGAGVQAGIRAEKVTPLAAASILARAAQVDPPQGAKPSVPDGLFKLRKE